jgi:uncharacterized membrane protein
MGIRDRLREADETVKRELRDERARTVGQMISARALGIGVLVAFLGGLALLLLPLSDRQRMAGMVILLFAVFLLFTTVMRFESRRYRVLGLTFRRAIMLRSIVWLPVATLVIGLVFFAFDRSLSRTTMAVLPIFVGLLAGLLVRYWYYGRRLREDGNDG